MTPEAQKELDLLRASIKITVNNNIRDYSDDPCFKRSLERAQANLKKYGLPEAWKKKNN